jgi:hypothetical protein
MFDSDFLPKRKKGNRTLYLISILFFFAFSFLPVLGSHSMLKFGFDFSASAAMMLLLMLHLLNDLHSSDAVVSSYFNCSQFISNQIHIAAAADADARARHRNDCA